MMMQMMQQMQLQQQAGMTAPGQQGMTPTGGAGGAPQAFVPQPLQQGYAPPPQPIQFNPETGLPMAPAHMVLPQTVQPIAGPAPTPVDPAKLKYQNFD